MGMGREGGHENTRTGGDESESEGGRGPKKMHARLFGLPRKKETQKSSPHLDDRLAVSLGVLAGGRHVEQGQGDEQDEQEEAHGCSVVVGWWGAVLVVGVEGQSAGVAEIMSEIWRRRLASRGAGWKPRQYPLSHSYGPKQDVHRLATGEAGSGKAAGRAI